MTPCCCVEAIAPSVLYPIVGCNPNVIWRDESPQRAREVGTLCRSNALTIDDFPRKEARLEDACRLLRTLQVHGARATFFVIESHLRALDAAEPGSVRRLLEWLNQDGHKIGVHFAGSCGCIYSSSWYDKNASTLIYYLRSFRPSIDIVYVRPPGGCIRYAAVSTLQQRRPTPMKTVIGTVYACDIGAPGPCDLYPSAWEVATCTRMLLSSTNGRIVILHDTPRLIETLELLFEQLDRSPLQVEFTPLPGLFRHDLD